MAGDGKMVPAAWYPLHRLSVALILMEMAGAGTANDPAVCPVPAIAPLTIALTLHQSATVGGGMVWALAASLPQQA